MASIKSIVRNRKGKAGHNNSWEVHDITPATWYTGEKIYALYHYGTAMLEWHVDPWTNKSTYLWSGIGSNSVSDQMGMNKAFIVLGFPFYFSRKNARIQ